MKDDLNSKPLDLRSLSKVVSHALRHEPWLYEIELDKEGWTSLEDLLVALRTTRPEWSALCRADLLRMIEDSPKRRHEIKDNQIRARYGHSTASKLKMTAATPPSVLWHGTSPEVVNGIKSRGLLPMTRQYVHLSVNKAVALEVG